MPWQIIAPYRPDPEAALHLVQEQYFRDNYDLAAVLAEHIRSMEDAVRLTRDKDEYGLHDTYNDSLRRLQAIASEGLPQSIERQIEVLREIEAISSSEIGNVLDLRGVSERREPLKAMPLNSIQVQKIFGTDRPTREQAGRYLFDLYGQIGRAEAVCFPIYRARKPRRPFGWYFIGYTAD